MVVYDRGDMRNIIGKEDIKNRIRKAGWLILPVFMMKTWIYYWQVHMLDLMNIGRYLRILISGEEVPAYEMVCVYEAPLLTILLLWAVYDIGSLTDRRWRRIFFYFIYTLITLVMLADAAYCGYFGRCISVNQLRQIGSFFQIAGDGNVIGAALTPLCLLTLLDYPIVIRLYKRKISRLKDKEERPGKWRILLHFVLLTASCISWLYYSINPSGTRDVQRVSHVEFFTSHTNDIIVNVIDPMVKKDVDEKAIQESMNRLVPRSEGDQYHGLAKGKNLILIQTESLNDFVVGATYNGEEITPNMNRMLKEDTLYFDRFFSTTGIGNTCDAEFSVLNSLYPNNIRECYRMYVDNTYDGLPWMFRDAGYDALAFHGYIRTFWNRGEAYKNQGFRKFYSEEELDKTEVSGFGLTDKELFRQGVDILKQEKKPFFSFMVTLTNHIPYELDPDLASLKLKPEDQGTLFGQYLQTVRYTDEAFGDLIRLLKENDMYDQTMIVIYGDHQGMNLETPAVRESMSRFLGRTYDYDEMLRVPLLIHLPGLGKHERVHTVGGQVDIMPTIANLMDLKIRTPYVFGHDLLNAKEGYIGQISYVGMGSFIGGSKDVIYVMGRDGTVAGGRMLSIDSGEELPMDESYCQEQSDRALDLIGTCKDVLDHNLIQKYVTH